MKRKLFLFSCFSSLASISLMGQNPGGITTAKRWYFDAGSINPSTANGSNVSSWSSSAGSLTLSGSGSATYWRGPLETNFQPSIEITDNTYFSGGNSRHLWRVRIFKHCEGKF